MAVLYLLRLGVYALVTLFALVTLGLGGHQISLSSPNYADYQALAVATAVLTLISLPVQLVIDRVRDGAFTSFVWVELCLVAFLWIMWLATGADAASYPTFDCSAYIGGWRTACDELRAIEAFGFLNWIILVAYWVTVLTFAINAASNGRPSWQLSTKELTWRGDGANPSGVATAQSDGAAASYPLASQSGRGYAGPNQEHVDNQSIVYSHPTSQYASV